ncbi:MAG: peptidoglycan DD-metalloendopeptidase family protein, partial [Candidatus Uhrbacteria bacterium]
AMWKNKVLAPLVKVGREKNLDVSAKVAGGGIHAQAEEPFLWAPFTTDYELYISCHWTCFNSDGSVYNHRAIDYGRVGHDTEIRAADAAHVLRVVESVPRDTNPDGFPYGNYVKLQHPNNYVTIYAHFLTDTIEVKEGDFVEAGDYLGLTDNTGWSTGPHLHFEVRDPDGVRVNPYGDPPSYPDEGGDGCGPGALWARCPPIPYPERHRDNDGDGYTAALGDCDDTNPGIHPGVPERCDGLDNDCDGITDRPWNLGLATDVGNECHRGTGVCRRDGTWECTPDGLATVCNSGIGTPSDERCDSLDNDCDGVTDEDWRRGLSTDLGIACSMLWPGCGGGVTYGEWACTPDGLTSVCNAPALEITSRPEVCNRIDDDCDGFTDNVTDEYLATNHSHCGACFNNCNWDWSCEDGACVSGRCSFDACIEYCDSTVCGTCTTNWTCRGSDAFWMCEYSCYNHIDTDYRITSVRYCLCEYGCEGCEISE